MPPDVNRNDSEPKLSYTYWMPLPIEDSENEEEPEPQEPQNRSRNRNRNRNRENRDRDNESPRPTIPALLRALVAPQIRRFLRFLENRRASRRANIAAQTSANQPSTSAEGPTSETDPSTSVATPATPAVVQSNIPSERSGRSASENRRVSFRSQSATTHNR